ARPDGEISAVESGAEAGRARIVDGGNSRLANRARKDSGGDGRGPSASARGCCEALQRNVARSGSGNREQTRRRRWCQRLGARAQDHFAWSTTHWVLLAARSHWADQRSDERILYDSPHFDRGA